MDQLDSNKIKTEIEELRARLESVQEENRNLSLSLVDASRNIAELSATVEMLKTDADETDEDGAGGDEAKELSVVTSAAVEIEDQQVVDPDSYAFSGSSTRKSIEWAPEMANIPQLHEFDDAPTVGRIRLVVGSGSGSSGSAGSGETSSGSSSGSGGGKTVTLSLVDPDGGPSNGKWMVPLRENTSSGIILHWADIGNSVTFEVGGSGDGGSGGSGDGGQPCPPELSGDCSGGSFVLTLKNYVKEGSGCAVDDDACSSVTIPGHASYSIEKTSASGACVTQYKLRYDDCDDSSGYASGTIEVPTPDSLSVTQQGSGAGRTVAGTITITHCSGADETLTVYNGKDGQANLNGTFVTAICGLSMSGNYIILNYEETTYTNGVAGVPVTCGVSLSGTTCENGG